MQAEPLSTGKKALRAGAWTVGSRLIAKLIDLGMLLCLARFLGPADFGLVATAMAAVFVIEALFELPMAAALIRAPHITQDMLHTAFTLSFIRGLVIAALLLLISVPLSKFSNEPRLVGLLATLSLAPALRGLVSPRLVEYTRAFNFRPDALMELSGKVVAFVLAVSIAVSTQSYWAIVAATVGGPLVSTGLSYIIAPLRPKITLILWKEFSNLIGWNFVAQLCGALNWQIDRLLIPRFTTTSEFGQYAMGKQISEIPIQALITPLHRPTMAALASAGEDRASRYIQLSQAVALLLVPVLGVPLLWPEVVVRIGLGSSWSPAAEWLRWISAITILSIPAMLLAPVAMTLDRTRSLAIRTIIELAFRIPLVFFGVLYFGIPGAIGASAIATIFGTLVAMIFIRIFVGVQMTLQILALWRPAVAIIPSGAILWFGKTWVDKVVDATELFFRAAPVIGLYLTVFVLAVFWMWQLSGRPPGLEKHLSERFGKLYNWRRYADARHIAKGE